MSETIEHELSALGAGAIDEANPCGISARYEPEFEQLEAEMAKLESLKGDAIDWRVVVQLSSEILQKKSKDLLVAVYLCQGLLQTEGYRGFAVGLKIISDMVDRYWEPMFPPVKRLRARKVAMEWLSEKASFFINGHAPGPNDNDAVIQAAQVSRELDGTLAEKMGDEAPGLTDLTRPLKQFREAIKQQEAKKPAPEPAKAPADPAGSPPSGGATSAPEPKPAPAPRPAAPAPKMPEGEAAAPVNVESDADARKALRQLQDGIRKVAAFYSKAKASDPKAYRLGRTAVWMTIDQLPPHKDGVTQIPAPPADRRKHLAAQFDQAQFSTLVPETEQLVSRFAFWLDGHRLVAGALKSMGAEYAAARDTVIAELRHFLSRVPGVTDLKFADGTPFADDATRMWIDSEVMAAAAGGEGGGGRAQASTPWNDMLNEARGMAAGGKTEEAVRRFHAGIAQAGTTREKFYWRTALAEFLIQSGNVGVAIQLLEQMTSRIEQQQLEEWESELVVPIYRRLFDAYQKNASKKKGDAALTAKIENVYSRLCWLDPTMAITVKGE